MYAFGSALRSSAPADVDLVVVYEPPLTPLTAPTVRLAVEAAVAETSALPVHLMFFSLEEAAEPGTLSDLNPTLVFKREARGEAES